MIRSINLVNILHNCANSQVFSLLQGCLSQMEEDFVLNPLLLSTNLYQHLRSRGLLSQPRYPYRSDQFVHLCPNCQSQELDRNRNKNVQMKMSTVETIRSVLLFVVSGSSQQLPTESSFKHCRALKTQ